MFRYCFITKVKVVQELFKTVKNINSFESFSIKLTIIFHYVSSTAHYFCVPDVLLTLFVATIILKCVPRFVCCLCLIQYCYIVCCFTKWHLFLLCFTIKSICHSKMKSILLLYFCPVVYNYSMIIKSVFHNSRKILNFHLDIGRELYYSTN